MFSSIFKIKKVENITNNAQCEYKITLSNQKKKSFSYI